MTNTDSRIKWQIKYSGLRNNFLGPCNFSSVFFFSFDTDHIPLILIKSARGIFSGFLKSIQVPNNGYIGGCIV